MIFCARILAYRYIRIVPTVRNDFLIFMRIADTLSSVVRYEDEVFEYVSKLSLQSDYLQSIEVLLQEI